MIYILYDVHEGGGHHPCVSLDLPPSHQEAVEFFCTEAEDKRPYHTFGNIRGYVIYRDAIASVRPDEVGYESEIRTAGVKAMALYEEVDERALSVDPMKNYKALEELLEEMLLGKRQRLFYMDRFPFLTYEESLRFGIPPIPKVEESHVEKHGQEGDEPKAGPSWEKTAPTTKRASPGAAKLVAWTCTILALVVLLALLELNLKIDYAYQVLRFAFTFKVTTLVEMALQAAFGVVLGFGIGFACGQKRRKE